VPLFFLVFDFGKYFARKCTIVTGTTSAAPLPLPRCSGTRCIPISSRSKSTCAREPTQYPRARKRLDVAGRCHSRWTVNDRACYQHHYRCSAHQTKRVVHRARTFSMPCPNAAPAMLPSPRSRAYSAHCCSQDSQCRTTGTEYTQPSSAVVAAAAVEPGSGAPVAPNICRLPIWNAQVSSRKQNNPNRGIGALRRAQRCQRIHLAECPSVAP
jgi:hypothetical protein